MRSAVLLASLAAAAVVSYVYAPQLIDDWFGNEPGVRAEDATVTQESDIQATPMAHARPAVPSRPAWAGHASAKPGQAPATAKPRHAALRSQSQRDDDGQAAPDASLTSASDLRPETSDIQPETGGAGVAAEAPADHGPVQTPDHWDDQLSGTRARLSMGRTPDEDRGCADQGAHCRRPEVTQDLSLAGVVVKTQRLAEEPTQPLEGKLRRGNYLDHTPAVYVK